jgi:hypothetical protein
MQGPADPVDPNDHPRPEEQNMSIDDDLDRQDLIDLIAQTVDGVRDLPPEPPDTTLSHPAPISSKVTDGPERPAANQRRAK